MAITLGCTWVITGTDTGVGKTVAAALLTRYLRARRINLRALKPFCSGSRDDAEILFSLQNGEIPLDEINPWHFDAPVAPMVAARHQKLKVTLEETLEFLRAAQRRSEMLLIEGAGGLLSPLGSKFCLREVIVALRALPLVVCPNRLGAINQARLVFAALPRAAARRAQLILMDAAQPDLSSRTNHQVLGAFLGVNRVHRLPWLAQGIHAPINRGLMILLNRLLKSSWQPD